jgi:transcription-repair coupling factor (superfamily II helicase)
MAVAVDLPLPTGIPTSYVSDQNVRLSLYRRIADVEDESELDALALEFEDRFGPLPDQVVNLFYQMRVKLRAEEAGLVSVAAEGDQVVLRFPPLPESVPARNLPPIGPKIRAGKNAYWMQAGLVENGWREQLLDTLSAIIDIWRSS